MKPNIAIELDYLSDCGFFRGNKHFSDRGEITLSICLSQLNIGTSICDPNNDFNHRYKILMIILLIFCPHIISSNI